LKRAEFTQELLEKSQLLEEKDEKVKDLKVYLDGVKEDDIRAFKADRYAIMFRSLRAEVHII
jgi:dsDNA-binding SOS-regulon protein